MRRPITLAAYAVVCSLALVTLGGASGTRPMRSLESGQTGATVNGDVKTMEQAGADGAKFMKAVRVLAPFVVRTTDGTLALRVPPSVQDQVSPRYFHSIVAGLAVLNARIRAGILETSTSGGVYPSVSPGSAATLLTQDGHTGVTTYWWGQTFCISHADLTAAKNGDLKAELVLVATAALGPWGGGTVLAIIVLYEQFDNGNGSCMWAPWTPPIWFAPQ